MNDLQQYVEKIEKLEKKEQLLNNNIKTKQQEYKEREKLVNEEILHLEGLKKKDISGQISGNVEHTNIDLNKKIRETRNGLKSIQQQIESIKEKVSENRKEIENEKQIMSEAIVENREEAKENKSKAYFEYNKKHKEFLKGIEKGKKLKLKIKAYENDKDEKHTYSVAVEKHKKHIEYMKNLAKEKNQCFEQWIENDNEEKNIIKETDVLINKYKLEDLLKNAEEQYKINKSQNKTKVGPDEKGKGPDEKGTDPDEKGTEPNEKGTDPDEKGTDLNEKGTDLNEKGKGPDEKGTDPDEKGKQGNEPLKIKIGRKGIVTYDGKVYKIENSIIREGSVYNEKTNEQIKEYLKRNMIEVSEDIIGKEKEHLDMTVIHSILSIKPTEMTTDKKKELVLKYINSFEKARKDESKNKKEKSEVNIEYDMKDLSKISFFARMLGREITEEGKHEIYSKVINSREYEFVKKNGEMKPANKYMTAFLNFFGKNKNKDTILLLNKAKDIEKNANEKSGSQKKEDFRRQVREAAGKEGNAAAKNKERPEDIDIIEEIQEEVNEIQLENQELANAKDIEKTANENSGSQKRGAFRSYVREAAKNKERPEYIDIRKEVQDIMNEIEEEVNNELER